MDSIMKPTPSEAHPETTDFLSNTYCNFAVQALQPQLPHHSSVVLLDNSLKKFDCQTKMEKSVKIDNSDFKSLPPWQSNDIKSWIWMQQAMHPELNYNRRKWIPWKIGGLKTISIKKWIKEIKRKRKEEERLARAEVHAAISVAGVAAALAAIASENSTKDNPCKTTKEKAVASAAALVAAHCAKLAEATGAKRDQLTSAIGSAMTATTATDILTLTAAAASTSLRGATTLKARTGYKYMLNGTAPVLPVDQDNNHLDFDFDTCKSVVANPTELRVETPDGNFGVRSVSISLNSQAMVVLKMRKLNLFKSKKKECIIMDVQAQYCKDSEAEEESGTCYVIVLRTNEGIMKLDMGDDYNGYKTWATTINHMLMLSSSCTKYDLQFYTN